MYKFLHTADIHLDSPLLNLDRYDGAPVDAFRSATRRALDNLVDLAISEQVPFVLIAGDLYDGDCRNFNTPLHFRRQMEKLRGHNIRVFIIQGNHDAANRMRKQFRLALPDNVHLFPTNKADTVWIDEPRVAIHGQGFAQADVDHDLSDNYPLPSGGSLNIGMLHTNCGDCGAHDRYAPSSVEGLTRKGYQYWSLGHIHQRHSPAGPDPWIVYPGNIQGRHIHEEGAKGCILATVEDNRVTKVNFRAVDVLRWQTCSVDAGECGDAESVLGAVESSVGEQLAAAEGRPLAVRVVVTGASDVHQELTRHGDYWDRRLREATIDSFDDQVWLEKIKFLTRPAPDLEFETGDAAYDELVSGIGDTKSLRAALAEVREDLERVLKQLPSDPRCAADGINLDNDQNVDAMLAEAREIVIGKLLESGDRA